MKKKRKVILKASQKNIDKFKRENYWKDWVRFLEKIFPIIPLFFLFAIMSFFDFGPFKDVIWLSELSINVFNFLKEYYISMILLVSLVFLLIFLIDKWNRYKFYTYNKIDKNSFKSMIDFYQSGNPYRVFYQTLISLPFYYYVKIKADEPLTFFKFKYAIEEADISYWTLFIPYLICYYLIKLELLNTNYDFNKRKFVDKNVAAERMGIQYGLFYGSFGYMGAALIDFIITSTFILRYIL